ncbi:hypothetical protein HPB48_008322 [Haemaphysalis longicornis]|uniref:Uncharacterized protein n=1 Tax=Haemaphysalis longicornis TaxID=44386 RepID=A0A9J6FSR5_HAELO|nr:hypothetical protein HPB48_008322 [Haemaphysalis longicornis]
MEDTGAPMSTIDHVHQWLTSIHVSAARTHQDGDFGSVKDIDDGDTSQAAAHGHSRGNAPLQAQGKRPSEK